MFDAFGADEGVGDGLDVAGPAADGDDFQAVVVVQMDVQGGEDHVVVIVLDVGEVFLQVRLVMVVDEGDGAGDFLLGVFAGDVR